MQPPGRPNRLSKESSPYLLQHALNPVNWYAWGDEALKKAKNDGKPIFLSIGYSTCHWCHVMAHESFEDLATAAVLNANFISIKVDREERPDLDAYYMNAVQAMTGQGGWPLSVFLTPDLRPFYGGTYFPPEPRYGMPSFVQVLDFVAKLWKDSRGEVAKNAEQIAKAIQEEKPGGGGELSVSQLEDGYAALAASFDPDHGGFGGAPKFPLPSYMEFMLRYHFRTGKELALRTVTKTLDQILAGGIRDHLGGGFHRYSTDRLWLVPHFEKMLYDNALLVRLILRAYKVTGNEAYSSAAKQALKWMLSELASEDGGFFCAQDADTKEGEGVFYTWTPQEVMEVVGTEAAEVFCHLYGVTKNGNFGGGRSILHLSHPVEEAAEKFATTKEIIEEKLQGWRTQLYEARLRRPTPATDTKILTAWNGLAISALAEAGQTLSDDHYLAAAEQTARFILSKNRSGEALLRKYPGGGAAPSGTLEDYAFLVEGLLDLFGATCEPTWLEASITLSEAMVDLFWDKEKGGFFTGTDPVPARVKDGHDGPTPSGNSVAALNLIRISGITGSSNPRSIAEKAVRYFQKEAEEQPSEHTYLLASTDMLVNGFREVAVTAKDSEAAVAMAEGVRRKYLPDVFLVVASSNSYQRLSKLTPLLEGRRPGPKPTAYVCQNFACKTPARTAEELAKQLESARG